MRAWAQMGAALVLGSMLAAGASAAGSSGTRVYQDPFGDAPCCTLDITRVVVSADPRKVTFRITAIYPNRPEPESTSDIDIPITTGRGTRFEVANVGSPGFELLRWSEKRHNFVPIAPVHVSVRSGHTVFLFSLGRRLLGKPRRFNFSVSFCACTSFGSNQDLAPDKGTWGYRIPMVTR